MQTDEFVWCDGCGAEVRWAPVVDASGKYCCDDCRLGEWCNCRERTTPDLDARRPVAAWPADRAGGTRRYER